MFRMVVCEPNLTQLLDPIVFAKIQFITRARRDTIEYCSGT
jgi:hypothetical protein